MNLNNEKVHRDKEYDTAQAVFNTNIRLENVHGKLSEIVERITDIWS